jgi:hypothetical protein
MRLVNFNKSISVWYGSVKEEFASFSQAPDWLKGSYEELGYWKREYVNLAKNYKAKLNEFKERSDSEKASYMSKLQVIEDEKFDFLTKAVKNYHVILIDKISPGSLPFETAQKLISFDGDELNIQTKIELEKYKSKIHRDYVDGVITDEDLINILSDAPLKS